MVFAAEDGIPGDDGQSEHDYTEKADTIRSIAACMQISTVSDELLALARQYEQLEEFTKERMAAWLLKIKDLTSEDSESPAP